MGGEEFSQVTKSMQELEHRPHRGVISKSEDVDQVFKLNQLQYIALVTPIEPKTGFIANIKVKDLSLKLNSRYICMDT